MVKKDRVRKNPYLAILGTKWERALIFRDINLLYIWSSKLISV
jgi:hypothetical protein